MCLIVGCSFAVDQKCSLQCDWSVIYPLDLKESTYDQLYSPGTDITLTGVELVDAVHSRVVGFPNNSNLTGGFIFHTADGGQAWQRQSPDGIFDPFWDVEFIDANWGYAVGFNYMGLGAAGLAHARWGRDLG